jgi:hypothetical protein
MLIDNFGDVRFVSDGSSLSLLRIEQIASPVLHPVGPAHIIEGVIAR